MRTDRQRNAGFTLIEVLVVMAILGIALALLITHGPARSGRLEAQAAASQVAQALRLGRSHAIASDRPVPVVLDFSAHRLSVDGRPPLTLPSSVAIAAQMEDGRAPARQAVFVFAPDGSATGGRISLAFGERRIGVTVDWLTGRVGIIAR